MTGLATLPGGLGETNAVPSRPVPPSPPRIGAGGRQARHRLRNRRSRPGSSSGGAFGAGRARGRARNRRGRTSRNAVRAPAGASSLLGARGSRTPPVRRLPRARSPGGRPRAAARAGRGGNGGPVHAAAGLPRHRLRESLPPLDRAREPVERRWDDPRVGAGNGRVPNHVPQPHRSARSACGARRRRSPPARRRLRPPRRGSRAGKAGLTPRGFRAASLYGDVRSVPMELESWPMHWLAASGVDLRDREPLGATHTVAELVSAAATGVVTGRVHGEVVRLAGTGGDRLAVVADRTGQLAVWCPARTSPWGPVHRRRFELELTMDSRLELHGAAALARDIRPLD